MGKLDIRKIIEEGHAMTQRLRKNPLELYEKLIKKDLDFYIKERGFPVKFSLDEIIHKNQFVLLRDKQLTSEVLQLILEDKDYNDNENLVIEIKNILSKLNN